MASEPIDVGTLLDSRPWGGYQKLLLGLVAPTVVLDGADNQLLGIALPALMRDWSAPRAALVSEVVPQRRRALAVTLTIVCVPVGGMLAFNLGGVIGAFAGAGVVTRFGSRPALLAMAAAAVASALVLAAMPIAASAALAAIGMLAVIGCLLNTVQIMMYSVAVHVYPTRVRATGLGWALSVGRSGAVLSTYAGEWALAAGGSAAFFGLIAASMATVSTGLAMVRRHIPRSPVARVTSR